MGFKIPYTNIQIGEIQNIDQRQPERTKIIQKLILRQTVRTKEDIKNWRTALLFAESVTMPDRAELIKIYNDVMLDGHINGIINAIKNKIKAKEFLIIKPNGEKDDDVTKLFEKEWFFKFLDFIIESKFWGYSLIQLGDIKNDGFPYIELVPREYVIPEWQIVKKDLYKGRSKKDGFFYNEPPLKNWFIFVGEKKDMGLLNIASPHALSKKNLLNSAWEFAELFGMPVRIGKTDIRDEQRRKQMEEMLEKMGSAAWGAFDKDDTLEFVESSKSDVYKVFIEPIKFSNDEISKAFTGQMAAFEEKSFVGSAQVQERLFNEFILSFLRQDKFIINNELIPKMVLHRMMPFGHTFKWKTEEVLSVKEKATIITDLTKVGYEFTPQTVTEEVGIPIESFAAPAKPMGQMSTVMNEVKELYSDFLNN